MGVFVSLFLFDQLLYRQVTFVLTVAYWSTEVIYDFSIGKRILGLRIKNIEVIEELNWSDKAIRFGAKHFFWIYAGLFVSPGQQVNLVPAMVCLGGYLLIFFTDKRALHDLVSGTVVVKW